MLGKILSLVLILTTLPIPTFAQSEADILLRDLIWNLEWAQQSVNDMTFTFVTAAAEGSSIDKLSETEKKLGRTSLPEEARMSVWIKKSDRMKVLAGDYKVIIRREGNEWFSYQYAYSTGQTLRQKLPPDSWPVWPSPGRIIANLKKYMAKATPHTIRRDDTAPGGANYVLTFKPQGSQEEYAYVIRIADWRILKSVFYENGQPSFVSQWRDVAVNTNIPDKVFDPAEVKDVAAAQVRGQNAVSPDAPVAVLYSGLVKKEIIRREGGYTLENNHRHLRNPKYVDEQNTVPGVLGMAFGFAFTVKADQDLSLTARYIHPALANPLTQEIKTVHETSLQVPAGASDLVSWVFTKEWEIVPGEWTLQLYENDSKLAEKKFTVTEEKDIYANLGEWGRRLPEFNKALRKNPKDAPALNGLGNAYSEMGDYPRAVAEYTKAMDADPKFFSAYNGRCDVYAIQKEFDKAVADCTKALELNPKYIFALINRGKAYDGKGDYARAILDYNKALELNPRNANAYFYRALTFVAQGNIDGAKADLEKVLEINPYDIRARKKLEDLL